MNKDKRTLTKMIDDERLESYGLSRKLRDEINLYYDLITKLKCDLDYVIRAILEEETDFD